jgi:hypothetical protein
MAQATVSGARMETGALKKIVKTALLQRLRASAA